MTDDTMAGQVAASMMMIAMAQTMPQVDEAKAIVRKSIKTFKKKQEDAAIVIKYAEQAMLIQGLTIKALEACLEGDDDKARHFQEKITEALASGIIEPGLKLPDPEDV